MRYNANNLYYLNDFIITLYHGIGVNVQPQKPRPAQQLLSPNSRRRINYSDVANKSISPLLTANPTSSNSAKL